MLFALSFLAAAEPTLTVKPLKATYTRPEKITIEASLSEGATGKFYYAFDSDTDAENQNNLLGEGTSAKKDIDFPAIDQNQFYNNYQAKVYVYARNGDKVYKFTSPFYVTIKSANPPRLLGAGIGNKYITTSQVPLVVYVEPALYQAGSENSQAGRMFRVQSRIDQESWYPHEIVTTTDTVAPFAFYVNANGKTAGQHDLTVRIQEVQNNDNIDFVDYSDEIPLTFRIQQ